MFGGGSRRLTLSALGLFAATLCTPAVHADSATPNMASETSKIRPTGERQIGRHQRATIGKRTHDKVQDRRAARVKLQIPEQLRALLAKKIERRISRNLAEGKKLRREALALLSKFLEEAKDDAPEMPEALLRIGELEWEDARDSFLEGFRRWERTPAEQRGAPPVPDYSGPRARFRAVLTRYKAFRNYDLALYVDGFLASEEGKSEEARARFDKIIEWFPKSRFVPDAYMARAEHEFTKDAPDYEAAYREYERVLQYPTSELYDLALFKSAWTLWRLGKSEEAARRFLMVFRATAESPGRKRRANQEELDELQSEALKNLVAVFVEDEKNSADDMHRFLVQAGGERFAGSIVRALAEAFYDQAHYERGIEAYRLLLKLEPTSREAYEHALKIAQAHSTLEDWPALNDDYRWILRDYVRPPPAATATGRSSAWLAAQPPDVLSAAERAAERQMRQDAVGLHAKAQADKTSRAEFEAAAELYRTYLSRFGARRESYEIHFNLAEIYFHRLDEAEKAAVAYLAAVRHDPKRDLSRTALYNALAALEVARAGEFEAARKRGTSYRESDSDAELTKAMELYVRSYPDDAQIPELLFRQGKLYYDYQVYDPAVRQWGLLLEKYPNSRFALGAGELILDSFNKSRDYRNIEAWARRLKMAPMFQLPERQARLDTLIVASVFKQGEQLATAGEHRSAAAAYLRAAREFPREPRAAQAAVNAEVEAKRAGDLATLSAAAELLVKDHQKRPEAAAGLWIAATTHQEVGLFSKAASYHALITDNWPRYEHHKDAAFNAVLLRATIGEHDLAIASGERFKRYYSGDEAADEVTFLMGKAHEKGGKPRQAAALYERYARSAKDAGSQIEAWVRLAGVSDDERSRSLALGHAIDVFTTRRNVVDDRGRYYAARARYMQGELQLAKFEAVKIEGDVKRLKERLKRKSELLKRAAEAFLTTAEIGVAEWTTASLYQIGFTYEAFAKSLLAAPAPENLSEAERELFRQSIEEFVIPIEERSLEAYESGWQKAIELNIFNAWTAKMRQALGRLNAELYPPLREIGFELRSRASALLPPLIQAPRRGPAGRSAAYLIGPSSAPAGAARRDRGPSEEAAP